MVVRYCDVVTERDDGELTIALIDELTVTVVCDHTEANNMLQQLVNSYGLVTFNAPVDGAPILINPTHVISAKWERTR